MSLKETECQCGRTAIHCPHCGYGGLVGLSSLKRLVEDVEIYSYRCRKCGRIFDDLSLKLCIAPHVTARHYKSLAKKADKIMSGRLPDWANKLRVNRGLPPMSTDKEPSIADEIDKKEEPT